MTRRPVLRGLGSIAAMAILISAVACGGEPPRPRSSPSSSSPTPSATPSPITGSWEPTAQPPTGIRAAIGLGIVWTGTEFILWGGLKDAHDPQPTSPASYRPDTDTWNELPPGPLETPRPEPIVVWTGNEMVVYGGTSYDGSTSCTNSGPGPGESIPACHNDGAAYDPEARTWRTIAASPLPGRQGVSGAWTDEHLVIVQKTGYGDEDVLEAAAYDPATDTWEKLPDSPLSYRERPDVFWTGSKLLVWGGHYTGDAPPPRDGALYDPEARTWTMIAKSPLSQRVSELEEWTGSEMIVWGGSFYPDRGDIHPEIGGAAYNPVTDTWRMIADAPVDLGGGRWVETASAWTGEHMVVAVGAGEDHPWYTLTYDPVSDEWQDHDVPPPDEYPSLVAGADLAFDWGPQPMIFRLG